MDELLNFAPCGFLSFTDDGVIHTVNNTLSEWLGYAPDQLEGHPVELILSIGGRIFFQTHIRPLLTLKGRAEEIYFSLKARDGQAFPVLTNAVRRQRDGVFISDCVFLPMTQRREYEDELLQAKKVAEEASLAKARFLSMMSHELRTPLNAILGFGQLLELGPLQDKQAAGVEQILKAGRHLLDLINEILDLSHIESGHLRLLLEPIPVNKVVADTVGISLSLAAAANISLQVDPSATVDAVVWADRKRLKQVLLNLLANAIKYNRPGGQVRISCSPDSQRIRFMVRDTGYGIPIEKQSKLFNPFERLGAEGTKIEGTGLGLAVCKRLAEAMNGEIGVESVEGRGSCFWITVPVAEEVTPLASAPERAQSNPQTSAQEAARDEVVVLYVEDNASNLKLVESILDYRPHIRLISTTTGEAGLQLARDHSPQLILLDLQLPDMMGDEVMEKLRGEESTSNIPVIILSADATPQQIERLLKAGAADYLTKPLDVSQFLSVMDVQLADVLD